MARPALIRNQYGASGGRSKETGCSASSNSRCSRGLAISTTRTISSRRVAFSSRVLPRFPIAISSSINWVVPSILSTPMSVQTSCPAMPVRLDTAVFCGDCTAGTTIWPRASHSESAKENWSQPSRRGLQLAGRYNLGRRSCGVRIVDLRRNQERGKTIPASCRWRRGSRSSHHRDTETQKPLCVSVVTFTLFLHPRTARKPRAPQCRSAAGKRQAVHDGE